GLIGDTPLVRLSRIGRGLRPAIVAKLEHLNPGGSVKDRIGLLMIEDAERRGLLREGGTIVEPTSGNTGVGLAMAAAIKGYRVICTMADKQSQEKRDLLRAYGAEVVVCPSAVPPESPESYYKVADRLTRDIPGAFQPNQYYNAMNPESHYRTTGPEIWRQTEGRITHLVAGVGTGGTVTGAGRFLKEQNKSIVIVGADPEGSLYTGDIHPYKTEGIGEDFYPGTFDPAMIDRWVRVSDRDSFLTARRLTREEGILAANRAVPDEPPTRIPSSMGARLRSGFVSHRASSHPRGRDPRRRLVGDSPIRRARGREGPGRERVGARPLRGLRPQLPIEDLQRRVDASERIPRWPCPGERRRRHEGPRRHSGAHRGRQDRDRPPRDRHD